MFFPETYSICHSMSVKKVMNLDAFIFKHSSYYCARLTPVRGYYFEPVHEISNKVVCATSNASDQPAHMRGLITAFASRLSIL